MNPHDRPASEPGGMQCEKCDVIFIGAEWHAFCGVCLKQEQPLAQEPSALTPHDGRRSDFSGDGKSQ